MPNDSSADALQEISEYLRILYLFTAVEDLHFLFTKFILYPIIYKYLTRTEM